MKVEATTYPGWNKHPVFRCRKRDDFDEVVNWMRKNKVESFLLSSGSTGYIFQVTRRHEWFALRWLS